MAPVSFWFTFMSSLAVDIGAESGRVVSGTLAGGKLTIEEVCRFPNTPIRLDGTLRWDIQSLIRNVRAGIDRALTMCFSTATITLSSNRITIAMREQTG
jgi:sugar (pentulose or hexulose) kinase